MNERVAYRTEAPLDYRVDTPESTTTALGNIMVSAFVYQSLFGGMLSDTSTANFSTLGSTPDVSSYTHALEGLTYTTQLADVPASSNQRK